MNFTRFAARDVRGVNDLDGALLALPIVFGIVLLEVLAGLFKPLHVLDESPDVSCYTFTHVFYMFEIVERYRSTCPSNSGHSFMTFLVTIS